MIKDFSNRDWNTKEKELPKVASDLFVRLFPNEATEENEAGYDQPPVKRTRTQELSDILSKNSDIDSNSKYFNSY